MSSGVWQISVATVTMAQCLFARKSLANSVGKYCLPNSVYFKVFKAVPRTKSAD